jgi:hypothetical protein
MNPTSTSSSAAASTLPQLPNIQMEQKPSQAMQLLWWCAGANGELLARCPTDYTKYGNIGATVLLTALLAFISMSYALNTVFDSLPAALGMGVVWAVVIFVLDRSIVSSMRKPPIGSSFFSKASFSEIPFLFVRLAVALVISFTISKPLEVKIFEKRIAAQIDEEELKKGAAANAAIDNVAGVNSAKGRIDQAAQDLVAIQERAGQEPPDQQYLQVKSTLQQQNADYVKTSSTNNTIIQKNLGRIAAIRRRETHQERWDDGSTHNVLSNSGRNAIGALMGVNRRLNQDIQSKKALVLKTKAKRDDLIDKYQQQLAQERGEAIKDQQTAKKAFAKADTAASSRQQQSKQVRETAYGRQSNGTYPLMTQISALGSLTDGDNALLWASRLITLLFLVIETAPILVKLFSKRGAYDDELELAEHISWVRTQYEKSQINSRINRKLEAINQTDDRVKRTIEARQNKTFETATKNIEQQQQIELANNERLLKLIAKRQIELAEQMVDQWHQAELSKLKNTAPASTAVTNPIIPSPIIPLPTSINNINQVP